MRYTKYPILLLFAFILACEDRDDGPLFEFAWDQTQCADPWGTGAGSTEAETEAAVVAYLEGEGISVEQVAFLADAETDAACEACDCGTGIRIIVTVPSPSVTPMRVLGFYLK